MNELQRRQRALAAAQQAGLDSLLQADPAGVRYLTGFTGSSGVVALTATRSVLFTDGRYTEQARTQTRSQTSGQPRSKKASPASNLGVIISPKPTLAATEWLAAQGARACGFDAALTTVAALDRMRKALPAALRRSFFVHTEASQGLVARLRETKDADEIRRMRRAAKLGCELFDVALQTIAPGIPETEVAAQMELAARRGGADGMSFETIVAAGRRSALPHGNASTARLPRRGFVTLDFGVLLDGYCSDMTRTVHIGKPTARERDVYHSVLDAQVAAVGAVRPGATCGHIDEAARSVLRKAGLARYFTHSTGHGVGLEIHEGPRVAATQQQPLTAGMVITIEPGAYLPGLFGVRIEDMMLVTARGGEVLTAASPKSWIEL